MGYQNAFVANPEQADRKMKKERESCTVNHAALVPRGVKPQRSCMVLSVLKTTWPPRDWYGPGILCTLLC